MAIQVHRTVEDPLLPEEKVIEAVEAALEHGGRAGLAVDVILVDDERLASMHGVWLGDPSETDVMAFDLGESEDGDPEPDGAPGDGPEAELYVSIERARVVAQERGVPADRELALYVVHGTLHLCGLDDHEPEEREAMRAAERAVLGGLGYPADELPHDR